MRKGREFMEFIGQTCPACGKAFEPNDDIVVCPVCGTPQHRSCWEENGECVNRALHSENYSWQPETPKFEHAEQEQKASSGISQLCHVCGARNDENALNCINCGAPLGHAGQQQQAYNPFFNVGEAGNPYLYGVTLDPESEIDGAKVKDIACTVQSASSRYIPKFKAMADKKKKVTFNWASFFFTPYWFFFRKMWKEGLIFLGVLLAFTLPFTAKLDAFQSAYELYSEALLTASQAEITSALQSAASAMLPIIPMLLIQFAVRLFAGFIANPLYKKSVVSKVKKIRSQFPNDREFEVVTIRKGGTSILLAFAAYIGYDIVYSMLLALVQLIIK